MTQYDRFESYLYNNTLQPVQPVGPEQQEERLA